MFKREVFAKAAVREGRYMRLSIPEYGVLIFLEKSKTAAPFYESFEIGLLDVELNDDVPGDVSGICWGEKKVYPVKSI